MACGREMEFSSPDRYLGGSCCYKKETGKEEKGRRTKLHASPPYPNQMECPFTQRA